MNKNARCWPLFFLLCVLCCSRLAFSQEENRQVVLLDGPEMMDLLEKLGNPLLKVAGLQPESIKFHVILDASLNAMALPNGHLVFNSGLILAVNTLDELAGVVAHEISHLAAGHHILLEEELKTASVQAIIASVMGIAASAVTGNGQFGQAAIVGGNAAARSILLESLREKESQADRLAIHYLVKVGRNPQGIVTFLGRILKEQRAVALPAPYLMTHPLSGQRVMEAEQMMAGMTKGKGENPEEHLALERVQAVLLAETQTDPELGKAMFLERIKKNPNDFAAIYGLSMVYRFAGEIDAAMKSVDRLLVQRPEDVFLLREKGLALLDDHRPLDAEKVFLHALEIRPESQDLRFRLALCLVEEEKLDQAARLLRKLTFEDPKIPVFQYQLGLVEGKRDHLGSAHLAMARYYALLMEDKLAVWHFKEALNQFPQASPEREIAQDALRNVQLAARKRRLTSP